MAGWHEEAGLPNMVFECDWPQKKGSQTSRQKLAQAPSNDSSRKWLAVLHWLA